MACKIGVLLTAFLLLLNSVHGYFTETLYATTSSVGKYVYSYGNNDRKVFYITPSMAYLSGSYYLEIYWSRFDVRGYMPYCNEDWVEVYLTRSYKSIGKFCSYNAGKPFKMYSHDGYAKVELISDGKTTGSGFTFHYKLKSTTSDLIGGSPSSTYCSNTYNYGSSGVFYSGGWPAGYAISNYHCEYLITRSSSYDYTKVVFMDVDMGSRYDYVKLYGSSYSSNPTYSLYKVTSTHSSTKSYKSSYKYLKLEFERRYGGSARGFVVGYIQYKKATETRDTSVKYSFSFVYLIPVIIVILFAIIVPYMKRRRHRLAMMRRSNMTIPMETHTTQPTAASNPPEVLPPSYPQGGAPYPTSYPASYDQSSLSTNPPPSYVWTTSSNDNPKPVGTLPPPYPPEGPYPPMPFSSPLPAPDAPPPSYDAAVQK